MTPYFIHTPAIRRRGVGVSHGKNGLGIPFADIRHKSFNALPGGIDGPDAGQIAHFLQKRSVFLPTDLAAPQNVLLITALPVHVRPFHIQTVQNPADAGLGCFPHPAGPRHHLFQIQIAVKGRQNRGFAVADEMLRALRGFLTKQMLRGAVGMDIDESGGCVQTARIDHIRAVRDDHRIRLSHLRDPIAFPCDGTVPDNAVFQDQFCIDNCFHGNGPPVHKSRDTKCRLFIDIGIQGGIIIL